MSLQLSALRCGARFAASLATITLVLCIGTHTWAQEQHTALSATFFNLTEPGPETVLRTDPVLGTNADIVFWNGNPFQPGTEIQAVMLEGELVYEENK